MATRTGSVGTNGNYTYFKDAQAIGITMGANEYPVTVSLSLSGGPRWYNQYSSNLNIELYLCGDTSWTTYKWLETWVIPGLTTQTNHNSWTLSAADGKLFKGKTLYLRMYNTNAPGTGWDTCDYTPLQHMAVVTVTTAIDSYSITTSAGTGGSLSSNKATAAVGETVTLTPTPSTGYQFSSYTKTPSDLTITNNQFTMPAQNVSITANFSKVNYTITKASSPSAGGSVTVNSTAQYGDQVSVSASAATGYQFSSWTTSPSLTISNGKFTMPAQNVSITANFTKINYTITKVISPSGGGTATIASTAKYGDTVTVNYSAATGYQFSSISTSPSLTVTNNKFTMPAQNVTVTVNFSKINYTITKAANPAAGGTVTAASTAQYGSSVSVSQSPATGYYFSGWTTSPSLTISNGAFTMPAQNVSITANYKKRSTASLSSSTLTGNSSVTLTISTESTAYSHKYKLSFGTNMETSLTTVAAGTTSVNISIPDSWSNYIPNATSKSGGTLLLETYSGSTKIGEYTISSLTYAVRANAVPTIGTITNSIVRTIGGTTYANVGNYYVQNHSGVRVQTTAAGVLGSTIASLKVSLNGYSGNSYVKTVTTTSIDFTTGLLTISGTQTITVNVTDSRGRTASKTATITVTAYNKPSGTLSVWRVDSGGTAADLGEYAKFSCTKSFSAIGSNSLTRKLTTPGYSAVTLSADSGDILPGSRKTYSIQQEYTITLTLQDSFETTTITAKLRSASFILYTSANGKKLGLLKAASKGGTNDRTIEFDGDATIYVGDSTLTKIEYREITRPTGTTYIVERDAFRTRRSGTGIVILSYVNVQTEVPNATNFADLNYPGAGGTFLFIQEDGSHATVVDCSGGLLYPRGALAEGYYYAVGCALTSL